MAYFKMLFLNSAFDDLKDIANKIIPDDPWAFVVQLTATFILVLILSKFLVKPVRNYIAQRQAFIQSSIDEANEKNEEATKLLDEAHTEIKEAKTTSKKMIEDAKVTALIEKDRIINETKEEVDSMKEKAHKDIENERVQMKKQLEEEVIDVALMAASKVVEREVSKDDNKKVIDNFIKGKEEIDG